MTAPQELINAVRTELKADSTLMAFLHADAQTVWEGAPADQIGTPLITWDWDQSVVDIQSPGRDSWDIDIKIFATRRSTCTTIAAHLADNYTIPGQKAAGVTSTNYRLTQLRLLTSTMVRGRIRPVKGGDELRCLVMKWRAQTRKRTAT